MSFFISRDKRMRWRPKSGTTRSPIIQSQVDAVPLQEQATSKVSDQGREFSTPRRIIAGVQLPEEIGRALTEVGNQFGLVPTCLVGGVFSVLGAAVGNGAILETSFFPAPVDGEFIK